MTVDTEYKINSQDINKTYWLINFIIYVSISYIFIILMILLITPILFNIFTKLAVLIWLITILFIYWKLIVLSRKIRLPFNKIFQLIIKRLLDFLISLSLLILLSPIALIIAISIKLTSRGSIFFLQKRVGLDGKKFLMYNFRTMKSDSPLYIKEDKKLSELDKSKFKLQKDPRVTRIGKFLRKYSLEEIPQLINVLKGEMTLVGPRPFISYEAEFSKEDIRNIRLSVLPGISGLWQISSRDNFNFESMINLDLKYIHNWSIFLDFKIIFKTFKKGLLSRRGY